MKAKRVTDIAARRAKGEHPLQWLLEPLERDPGFECRPWFGGRTVTVDDRHRLVLTCQGEPWQGVLVCTAHEHHPSLLEAIPALRQHPVLGKWLYLPEAVETFERDARALVRLAAARDPRLGVMSAKRKRAKRRIRFGDAL